MDIDACRSHPINKSLHFLPEAVLANLSWLLGRIRMPVWLNVSHRATLDFKGRTMENRKGPILRG